MRIQSVLEHDETAYSKHENGDEAGGRVLSVNAKTTEYQDKIQKRGESAYDFVARRLPLIRQVPGLGQAP